ncbi:hypothetical protein BC567DRAFT_234448 [Phyllosticta citribraziliensis]
MPYFNTFIPSSKSCAWARCRKASSTALRRPRSSSNQATHRPGTHPPSHMKLKQNVQQPGFAAGHPRNY